MSRLLVVIAMSASLVLAGCSAPRATPPVPQATSPSQAPSASQTATGTLPPRGSLVPRPHVERLANGSLKAFGTLVRVGPNGAFAISDAAPGAPEASGKTIAVVALPAGGTHGADLSALVDDYVVVEGTAKTSGAASGGAPNITITKLEVLLPNK